MLGDYTTCWGMCGSGASIYTMSRYMAPIEFFEEGAGLRRLEAAELHVVGVAIRHFVSKILDSGLPGLLTVDVNEYCAISKTTCEYSSVWFF